MQLLRLGVVVLSLFSVSGKLWQQVGNNVGNAGLHGPGSNSTVAIYMGKVPTGAQCYDLCSKDTTCKSFTWCRENCTQGWSNMCYKRLDKVWDPKIETDRCHWSGRQIMEVPIPTKPQRELIDMGLSQFLCYGVDQYATGKHVEHNCVEPGEPCLPASLFNPTELDTDQWVKNAVAFGAGEICLTAHHEGGFCLWPSKFSNYSVASSPYKKDIIQQFVTSCRKYNVRPCFYIGPNANGYMTYEAKLSSEEFLKAQMGMFEELLTNYGFIARLWWDHYPGKCPANYAPCPDNQDVWPKAWDQFIDLVRRVSPETVICPGPDCDGHLTESGVGVYPAYLNCEWDGNHWECPWTPAGDTFHPLETCVTPMRGWYEPNPPLKLNATQLWQHYLDSVGIGFINTVNAVPDKRGLIPDFQLDLFSSVGKAIRTSFGVSVGSVVNQTMPCSHPLVLPIDHGVTFNAVMTREDLTQGQRVMQYTLEYQTSSGGSWSPLPNVHGLTVGARIIDMVGPVSGATAVRFVCKSSLLDPVHIRSFTLHQAVPPA